MALYIPAELFYTAVMIKERVEDVPENHQVTMITPYFTDISGSFPTSDFCKCSLFLKFVPGKRKAKELHSMSSSGVRTDSRGYGVIERRFYRTFSARSCALSYICTVHCTFLIRFVWAPPQLTATSSPSKCLFYFLRSSRF